jgi:hypothetical protein
MQSDIKQAETPFEDEEDAESTTKGGKSPTPGDMLTS